MKSLLRTFCALVCLSVASFSASYYVDNEASGANDGTSWANAFTNLSTITWTGITPDSTVYISGGSTSKVYTNVLTLTLPGTPAYTLTNWLTFRVGQESPHNGKVIFDGTRWGDAMAVNFWSFNEAGITVDGSVGDEKHMIFQNMYNLLNKNYKVLQCMDRTVVSHVIFTNVSNAIMAGGNYTISNCEFHVRGDSAVSQNRHNTAAWGSAQIYSNAFTAWIKQDTGGGPDCVQIRSYTTVRNNTFRAVSVDHDTISNHHDSIQCIGQPRMIEIYGNEFINFGDAGITIAPSVGTDGLQDIRIYNNIFRQTELIDNVPEFIRFTTVDKTYNGFYQNMYIVNNLFEGNTNANTQIVSMYREYADAGIQGTNNWIANNMWVRCSSGAFNPMFRIQNTNNPSVWTIRNNIYNAPAGAPGHVQYYGDIMTAANFIASVDTAGRTNLPAFMDYPAEPPDFRLAPSDTVARGRGLDFSSIFTTDKDGNERGTLWDIGPYQYTDDDSTRYVATTGSDSNDGSADSPWLTIQKAANTLTNGQTVIVQAGTYPERVSTVRHGVDGQRITFRASGAVTMRGFHVAHQYITVRGFTITYNYFTPVPVPMVNVTTAGNHFELLSCTLTGGHRIKLGDVVWTAPNRISSATGGFLAAGFAGSTSGVIAVSRGTNISLLNMGSFAPTLVTDTEITVAGTGIVNDGPKPAWISGGYPRALQLSSPSSAVIQSNTFHDIAAHYLFIGGRDHLIERNTLSSNVGYDFIHFQGTNTIVRQNWFKDGGYGIYSPSPDIFENWPIRHENVHFTNNWIQNVVGAIVFQKGNATASGPLYWTRNVFIDVGPMVLSFPNSRVEHNTFLRAAKQNNALVQVARHPVSINANNYATNSIIRNNAFIDSGQQVFGYGIEGAGWYEIIGSTNTMTFGGNFVAGGAPGWGSKTNWWEDAGLNGGDPGFVNIDNPLGADGIPFTADDGLLLTGGSKLIGAGIGAADIGAFGASGTAPVDPGPGTDPDPPPYNVARGETGTLRVGTIRKAP